MILSAKRSELFAVLAATLAVSAVPVSAQVSGGQPQQIKDLDGFVTAAVERARQEFDVPGMAVAIVKDGHVVLAKGYGVRKTGEPAPVTSQTLFGIGSNSKAFTAAALAMLVDDGKIKWDDRVIEHLPEFAMSDAYVTREMRIRDLLCHRSGLGLGAGDLMFWPNSDLTADQIIYRLRFVPLATSFRSQYSYDNLLYNVAGAMIQKVSGLSWQQFIRERFYTPMGMNGSHTSIREVSASDDVAWPHVLREDKLTELPLDTLALDNLAPAGALVSSVDDMAKWVVTLLNTGQTAEGKRLVSERQIRELWKPAVFIETGNPPPLLAEARTNFAAYALGENILEYRGRLMVAHAGGLSGMVTDVSMIPDEKLGVIVLTNQATMAGRAIVATILDHYLNAAAKDWVGAYATLTRQQGRRAQDTVSKAAVGRNAESKPSLPLTTYAGRYRDLWYGDIVIEHRDGKLTIRFTHSSLLTGALEHWQYDTFVARWNDRTLDADAYVTFALNADGSISQVKMKALSPSTDFSFDFHDLVLKPISAESTPWD